jgi:hypothetical protein
MGLHRRSLALVVDELIKQFTDAEGNQLYASVNYVHVNMVGVIWKKS